MIKRVEYLDVAKGIGILLVVAGHIITRDNVLWNIIYAFHMPFFVFCSGIFYKQNRWKKRFFKNLLDYSLIGIIAIIIWYLIKEQGNIIYLKQSVFNIIIGGASPRNGIYPVEALWYLAAYGVILLIHNLVQKIYNKRTRFCIVVLIAIVGVVLGEVARPRFTMYYNLDVSMILYPFFYLGTKYNDVKETLKNKKQGKISVIVACALYLCLSLFNGYVNIYKAEYGKSVLILYATSVIGIFLIVFLSKKVICTVRSLCHLKLGLMKLGKHTLIIMGGHQLIIQYIKINCPNVASILTFSAAVLVTLFLSIACDLILREGEKWFKNLSFKR
ncbi:hypothetical protein B5G06_11795 [Flavonifractor sp. An52]|uniref:acyltransferase family protein n=1 Tax=Flavonifractor sp. An52 TaxID=1965642 RepID=UPI000B39334A|nr:acyltransferase family protein [Flavonifractor sp. An52]OUN80292.1 hypothetical protein B5G06_11795 [Flavonifractor sp. An52]